MTPEPNLSPELDHHRRLAIEACRGVPGVTGLGIGGRIQGGERTGEMAVTVFVERKKPLDSLSRDDRLPDGVADLPIDVQELGRPTPAGALEEAVLWGSYPHRHTEWLKPAPVLVSGGSIRAQVRGGQNGTLGCFLAEGDRHFLLTNMHVLTGAKGGFFDLPVAGETVVGSPNASRTVFPCCGREIGRFAHGFKVFDSTEVDDDTFWWDVPGPDAALVELEPGVTYAPQIDDLTPITGWETIGADDVCGLEPYVVYKRGINTRWTVGVVACVGFIVHGREDEFGANSFTNPFISDSDIVIRPIQDPNRPTRTNYFAGHGDSGAVAVNRNGAIVALVHSLIPTAPTAGPGEELVVGDAVATRFDSVMRSLQADPDLAGIELVTATYLNDIRTVPESSARSTAVVRSRSGALALDRLRVREQLRGSPAGGRLLAYWQRHDDELTALIRRDRRCAVVWQRRGGAEIVQVLLRLPLDDRETVPTHLANREVDAVVDQLLVAIAGAGSPELRTGTEALRPWLPRLAGHSWPTLLAALDETLDRTGPDHPTGHEATTLRGLAG